MACLSLRPCCLWWDISIYGIKISRHMRQRIVGKDCAHDHAVIGMTISVLHTFIAATWPCGPWRHIVVDEAIPMHDTKMSRWHKELKMRTISVTMWLLPPCDRGAHAVIGVGIFVCVDCRCDYVVVSVAIPMHGTNMYVRENWRKSQWHPYKEQQHSDLTMYTWFSPIGLHPQLRDGHYECQKYITIAWLTPSSLVRVLCLGLSPET